MVAIANALNVSLNYLLNRVADPLISCLVDRFGIEGAHDVQFHPDIDLPQTVAPYLPEGFNELSPEARKEVLDYVDYIMAKYAKNNEEGGNEKK